MKVNKIVRLSICLFSPFFILGCSNDYQVNSILTGTIEKVLMEEEILVIKGYGEEGSTKGIYTKYLWMIQANMSLDKN